MALCTGNSPVTGEFPAQRPVTRSFDVFIDLRLNKRLSKQSWGWWFGDLRRAYYGIIVMRTYINYKSMAKCKTAISPVLTRDTAALLSTIEIILVHWFRQNMTIISQTTFSNSFPCMEFYFDLDFVEMCLQGCDTTEYTYSISQEICTRFCCALLCYVIVHNEFKWSIYPYSSGLLCWHWGNR